MSFSPRAGAVISFTVEGAQEAQRQIETIGGSFDELSTVASGALKALAAGFAAWNIGAYVKDATLLAARYETLGIVMHTAGENAGYSNASMDVYAKGLEKSGISMMKAREAMVSMTTANLDNTKSLELGRLAQNLAVVANKSSSETLTDLITNIQQADTEGLKYMGIILNQDEALQKYATSHNTVTKALTQTQKAEAIQQAVMLQGAKYAGIYEKAMGTAGKALGSLDRYFENIKVRLGNPFLEGFAQGVFGVTDGVKQLNTWLDDLEKNGAMEALAKSIGSSVGGAIGVIKDIVGAIGDMGSAFVSTGKSAAEFFDKYMGGMTTIKVATIAFALLLSGFMVEQAVIGFNALSAAAWGAVLKVGSAFAAMSAAATTMVRGLQLSAALIGWGPAILLAGQMAIAAIGTTIAAIPGAIGAVALAAGAALGYVLVKGFGDSISKGISSLLPTFIDNAVDKAVAYAVEKFSGLPKVSEAVDRDNSEDATKAAANKAEKDRKEQLMREMNASIVAAESQIAITSATNTKLKALNELRDQQLKQSLDQRIITQADYLQKKEKMDVDEAQGQVDQIAAQKAQLAAYMAAFKAGAPLGQGRDPAADANEMTKLLAEETAAQTKLGAVKQNYAYQIAGSLIESYTREYGSISSIVDAQEELNRSTRQTYQQAGMTAEQQQIWSAKYLQDSADRLSATLEEKTENGTASKEYIANTSAMVSAMTGLAAARMKAVAPGIATQFINDTKTMRDQTDALYDDMRNTIVGTDEARIRSAAAASIKLASIRLQDGNDAINGSSDSDADKLSKRTKLWADYSSYVSQVNASADAQVMQSSEGYKTLSDVMSNAFDPARVQSFGAAMKDAFGTAGEALGGLVDAFSSYNKQQSDNDKARQTANELYKNDAAKLAAAQSAITTKQQTEQLAYYANMADAAKSFFKEGSSGYKVMQGISAAYHAAEMVLELKTMATKLSATSTVTAAKTAAAVEENVAVESTVGTTLAAESTKSSAYGVSALAASLAAPFPENLAAYATVAAMLAAIGVAVSGGGSSQSLSEQRQASQGTGTVLGDSSAKSESLNKAIELTAANTSTQINYLAALNTTLNTISSNITSFASQAVQSGATDASSISLNTNNGLGSTLTSAALVGAAYSAGSMVTLVGSVLGPVGAGVALLATQIPVISNIIGKIGTAIFGGKQSVDDTGISLASTTVGNAVANGVHGVSYADITTSGGWFSSDKHSEQSTDLSDEANQQFTTIIKSIATSITQASGLLGVSGDAFTDKLNSFVIDIGKISLDGLSSDEVESTLESVFSKLGDQMASAAIPDLEQFQQVGEGYLETLVRVASDYAKVDASLQSIGMTFGSVGVASIGARENLISLLGGIDDFQSKTADFASNFLTTAQQLAPVQAYVTQKMTALGLSGVTTREQFAQVVTGLDLTTDSGQATYAALMNLESAFAAVTPAIADATMSAQDIADQTKDLQDKYDDLTMTSEQLRAKELATIDASNIALYNQVQAATTAASALDLQAQIYEANGDTAGAAAVLLKQHELALAQTDPALRALTQQLWDLQAASTAVDDLKSAATSLVSDAENAFTTLQTVTKTTTDAVTARITAEQALSDAVKSTLSSMTTSTTTLMDRTAAQAQISAAVASVKAGGALPDADSLKDALSVVSQDASSQFATQADYLKDLYSTQNDLSDLGDLADSSLSTDQAQLDSLNAMLDTAQEQLNVLKGISTASMTIAQALAGFQTALASAQANPVNAATSAISTAYQTSLGRTADSAGLTYWQNQAAAGTSVADITSQISNSAEAQVQALYQNLLGRQADAAGLAYWLGTGETVSQIQADIMKSDEYRSHQKALGVPGFASGGDFAGGLRLVGENGPELEVTGPSRIFNANQTSSLMRSLANPSSNNDALVAAVKALQQEVAALREANSAENLAIAKSSAKSADALEGATSGNRPLITQDHRDTTV